MRKNPPKEGRKNQPSDREHKIAYTIIMDFLSFVNCSEPAGTDWQVEQKRKIILIILQLFCEEKCIIIEVKNYLYNQIATGG